MAVSGDSLNVNTAPGSENRITTGGSSHALSEAIESASAVVLNNQGTLLVNGGQVELSQEQANDLFTRLISAIMNVFNRFFTETKQPSRVPSNPGKQPEATAEPTAEPTEAPVAPTEAPADTKAPELPGQNAQNAPSERFELPNRDDQNAPSDRLEMPNQDNQNATSDRPEMPGQNGGRAPSDMPNNGNQPGMNNNVETASEASEVVTGITHNSAMDLEADLDNATTYTITEDDSTVKISDSGTYIVTGSASSGSITVKKGTTGVVLVLEDLDLTSTSGATLSINKNAEVQVIISGTVKLTDAENPEDEDSEDEEIADAYDGAAIKVKAGSVAFITGDGELIINGEAKNGIKAGDDSSLIIGGEVEIDITAANDGINANYDVAILSGSVTVSAADDGIHADHILTIGDPETGDGPEIDIAESREGLEGTIVNIYGGEISVKASDDGINAANGEGVYEDELTYSINQMGGNVTINAGTDGMDSNGDINLIGGSATIRSANNGGDAGLDYDGQLYISEEYELNNYSGVAGPDGMPGGMNGQMPGDMNGQQGGMPGQQNGMNGQRGGMPGQMNNRQAPGDAPAGSNE